MDAQRSTTALGAAKGMIFTVARRSPARTGDIGATVARVTPVDEVQPVHLHALDLRDPGGLRVEALQRPVEALRAHAGPESAAPSRAAGLVLGEIARVELGGDHRRGRLREGLDLGLAELRALLDHRARRAGACGRGWP
ncbi:MAG: hypothetical protein U0359_23110 [Byssovorax sp.]